MPKFVPRQRKHKVLVREKKPTQARDSNVTEIQPISKSEREEKKRILREELAAQQPKISGKKQKRLDKYIENKLKKDENQLLIRKLAKSKIDTTLLQSSRDLRKNKKKVQKRGIHPPDDAESSFKALGDFVSTEETDSEREDTSVKNTAICTGVPPENVQLGSGLKRPLEIGADGFPILKKRKKNKTRLKQAPNLVEEPEWEGFGSEDSALLPVDSKEKSSSPGGSSGHAESFQDGAASGSEGNDTETSTSELDDTSKIGPRKSTFKAWAVQQINEAVGFVPTQHVAGPVPEKVLRAFKITQHATPDEAEPLPPELLTTNPYIARKAFSVQVSRPDDIQEARLKLPVVGEEQKIMEAIHNNSSVVVWGATGSGKTTQLPQFLFEAGYGNPDSNTPGMIGITQPRRVAAVSMANRVGVELGEFSDRVSYQIRFDSTVSAKTAIKFMTDGVLIREIAQDFSLSKYSVIIIDEAHERSVNTDLLIGMVSRIVDLRKSMSADTPSIKPLRLVIMSATLRISDFIQNSNLFKHGPPPLVQAEGRQYPVTVHFARRTHRDYIEEAYRKICKGHRKLPAGGFLVFLTGQGEIKLLAKRLNQALKSTHTPNSSQGKVRICPAEAPLEADDIAFGEENLKLQGEEEDAESDIEFRGLDDDGEDEWDEFDQEEGPMDSGTQAHILPLYSQLPTKEQLKIFEPVPEGSRLIVLATNVAETSLTIPGVRYVFDCGRSKEKQYDISTGVQSFQIGWISKASASQRAGRAGRTGPGHCYRLYSSAVFEDAFAEYTEPEILRTPIEGVVLQMKSMGLHHIISFPFPTPPNRTALTKAESLLKYLGALGTDDQVTEIGRHLTLYPLSPRFGKMLHIGYQHGCMPYVIAMVSALAVSDLFIQESQLDLSPLPRDTEHRIYTNTDRLEDTAREQRKRAYHKAHRIFGKYDEKADALKFLAAVCAYAYATNGEAFCSQMFVRQNAIKEASQLRQQLTGLVRLNTPSLLGSFEPCLPEPSDKQLRALKQITAAGFIDQIAIRADAAPVPPAMERKPKRAIDVPYFTLFASREGRAIDLDEKAVYLHPSSCLARLSPAELPQYLVYSHLQQSTTTHVGDSPKVRMFPLTPISGLQLSALAQGTPLIQYGKPIGKTETLGGIPERRECWVIPSLVGEPGSHGWPLPAKKVVQKKDRKEGWVIERFV
ncbi:putative ATP-dependent RNA helicase DHR1 [Ophidiomyces ophidiicola]|uniref:ATP-dependent RNA helicase DHR1 n=1 Tax=Ophidiomyces ophidiicola TaxID=1387563 RepID=A0ACB8V4L9_9EURO|nr:putative ATP-dependent RNA helicase DHR1 [Ophidiomyces ophidiicola]KAI1943406.1 putative ATP-dependent RNA helicase DHR1 [Ophidiomyces ophidiicola]KAI1968430.1 putative ATP-dependent RNA helicase DHR1 [Ophidiomyces ophidiicola]KAI1970253.1 putative ATP-dependent RNA helicase DHR1 [Ophidiomyces ophidiicola]KAI2012677.1 putative ATP-dependent RNA helicase DHR1 [Ophidiomyces ophidiicola]